MLQAGGSFDALGVASVWQLPLNTFDSPIADGHPVITDMMVGIRIHGGTSALHGTAKPEKFQSTLGKQGPQADNGTLLTHPWTIWGWVSIVPSLDGEKNTQGCIFPFPFGGFVSLNRNVSNKPNVRARTSPAFSGAEHQDPL